MNSLIPKKPIVITAPGFDENSGGSIVLHYLAYKLREIGADAYLYPIDIERRNNPRVTRFDRVFLMGSLNRWRKKRANKQILIDMFSINKEFCVPVWRRRFAKSAIVVYPEIVSGNPLRSERVIRWLLNKPNFINPDAKFGSNELFFHHQLAFLDKKIPINKSSQLRLRWIRDDIYKDRKLEGREGACRLIGKGKRIGLDKIPDDGSVLIDGLSHEEKANVFNRTKFFYSHDPYTMHCFYAAICGCIPIVIPVPGVGKEEWRQNIEDRYGVAYGEDDIHWAVRTRHLLIKRVYDEQKAENEMIQNFLRIVSERFG